MPQRLEQTTSPLWFLRNGKTLLYFFRELTGLIIAAYCVYFSYQWYFDEALTFVRAQSFYIFSMVTFAASILHTLTWLWVTTQVTPVPLPQKIQYALFAVLVLIFGGISYGMLQLFYIL